MPTSTVDVVFHVPPELLYYTFNDIFIGNMRVVHIMLLFCFSVTRYLTPLYFGDSAHVCTDFKVETQITLSFCCSTVVFDKHSLDLYLLFPFPEMVNGWFSCFASPTYK